jgi:hypothetical protein
MELESELNVESEKNELDASWIEEFESLDEDYKSFYLEDITYIKIHYIYVNKENDTEMMKEETILLREPNIISREELIGILKKNNANAGKQYAILSILKYNMDIDPSDIQSYLEGAIDQSTFLTTVQHIDTIVLNRTISMFQDLNNLVILFCEKDSHRGSALSVKSLTKRIYLKSIHGKRKKTIRKNSLKK